MDCRGVARPIDLNVAYGSRFSPGRVEVPVSRAAALYANFEHVRGVPAESGATSLDRLTILNAMIERLRSVKPEAARELESVKAGAAASGSSLESMLAEVGSRLHAVATRSNLPYAASLPPGSVFEAAA
jgi:hypothetical protein